MFHAHVQMVLIGAAAYLPLVIASIYPTQPVQNTVWPVDQPVFVSWVEDWKYPTLNEMGAMDITLWCDTDTYLVQLASGVDPMTKAYQVTVPGTVLTKGSESKYTLRFTTSQPIDTVIYSADFTIVPANTTTGTWGGGVASVATQSGIGTGTGTWTGSGFKTVTTSAGSGSSSSWSTVTTSATGLSTMPSGVPPPSGAIPGGGVPGQGQRAANAGRKGLDVEKLKFQFVFVIWPVLMGVTMAL